MAKERIACAFQRKHPCLAGMALPSLYDGDDNDNDDNDNDNDNDDDDNDDGPRLTPEKIKQSPQGRRRHSIEHFSCGSGVCRGGYAGMGLVESQKRAIMG